MLSCQGQRRGAPGGIVLHVPRDDQLRRERGKTKLTVEERAFALDETGVWMIGRMDEGWVQTLDCLDELLATLVRT